MSTICRLAARRSSPESRALLAAIRGGAGPRLDGAGPSIPPLAKVVTCAACHGVNGNSQSDAMPIIAGMDAGYFKKQVQSYAAGARPSPEMGPYSKQILDIGVDGVAAYFAAQKMEPTPIKVDAAAVERGRVAAASCVVCHGANGQGRRRQAAFPSLAGQAPGIPARPDAALQAGRAQSRRRRARRAQGADEDDPRRADPRPRRLLLEPPVGGRGARLARRPRGRRDAGLRGDAGAARLRGRASSPASWAWAAPS